MPLDLSRVREVFAVQGSLVLILIEQVTDTVHPIEPGSDTLEPWSEFKREYHDLWGQGTKAELSTADPPRYVDSISFLLQYNVAALLTSERELHRIFDILYNGLHNFGASLTVQPSAAQYRPIGDPDYIFHSITDDWSGLLKSRRSGQS